VDRLAKETIYKLPLVLEAQPEGGYTVTCPLLPELITEGDTVREALTNAEDALAAVLEAFEEVFGSSCTGAVGRNTAPS